MIAAYLTYIGEGEDESEAVRKLLLYACGDLRANVSKEAAESMGIPPAGFDVLPMMEKGEHGKPYFPDYPNIHFSLSHTKGCVCCALSDSPVGIDVERIREIRYMDAIVDKFAKDEQDYIRADKDPIRFFRVWTGKESYTKRDGRGFLIPPDSFSVFGFACCIRFLRAKREEYVISVCGDDCAKKRFCVKEI